MTATNFYHIGVVKEVAAGELLGSHDVVIYKGMPQTVIYLEHEGDEVRIGFALQQPEKVDKWDLILTKDEKVLILGTRRITGLKEKDKG